MNGPRSLPYAFRVVEVLGWAWLYDNSSRTFCCTSTPSVYAEALYPIEDEVDEWAAPPDSAYFEVSRFCDEGLKGSVSIELDDEYTAPEAEEKDAWDAARDEASANHRL
jgi:hypothetical protein